MTDAVSHCLGTATAFPVIDPDCVWPGDADHDHIVDLNDFLAIGVAFGDTGALRPNAVNTWLGQPAPNWVNVFPSGENHKHADSDGNGLVDYPDTVCVSLHQGFTHLRTGSVTTGIPLRITPRISPFAGQDTVALIVTVGDATFPADSVYGLTFQIDYATTDVFAGVGGSASNSFLGNPAGPLMHISDEDANAGRFGWAMVRNDHLPASGHGEVCRITLKARPALWSGHSLVQLPLRISHLRLIDPRGMDIPVAAVMDTVLLYDLGYVPAAEAEAAQAIEILPNPAADEFHLRLPGYVTGLCTIVMLDAQGREVLHNEQRLRAGGQRQELKINVQHLPIGVYALQLSCGREMLTDRVMVLR